MRVGVRCGSPAPLRVATGRAQPEPKHRFGRWRRPATGCGAGVSNNQCSRTKKFRLACRRTGQGKCRRTGQGKCRRTGQGKCRRTGQGKCRRTGQGKCRRTGQGKCRRTGQGKCRRTGQGKCRRTHRMPARRPGSPYRQKNCSMKVSTPGPGFADAKATRPLPPICLQCIMLN